MWSAPGLDPVGASSAGAGVARLARQDRRPRRGVYAANTVARSSGHRRQRLRASGSAASTSAVLILLSARSGLGALQRRSEEPAGRFQSRHRNNHRSPPQSPAAVAQRAADPGIFAAYGATRNRWARGRDLQGEDGMRRSRHALQGGILNYHNAGKSRPRGATGMRSEHARALTTLIRRRRRKCSSSAARGVTPGGLDDHAVEHRRSPRSSRCTASRGEIFGDHNSACGHRRSTQDRRRAPFHADHQREVDASPRTRSNPGQGAAMLYTRAFVSS